MLSLAKAQRLLRVFRIPYFGQLPFTGVNLIASNVDTLLLRRISITTNCRIIGAKEFHSLQKTVRCILQT